ncbi:TetR family transcriptional regulator C-terminal domain-containing protein [Pedobacter sp. PLR]|uniref:TetR family transcriptional regulator C-terminal domain-containing protein n=1 Tax=Pedobacter sp. PLR TaxID=2994465 RepID=UPI002246BDF4|nr:TetR family transcriptional regulator C-terminal domain-containing protein [Pedobacter sp. PLR]MCX2450421.1 TetR family transcriptional regulator C-terminal domain-containing protein [Pedobacter sp. PLR]
MATAQQIKNGYIDYVLLNGEQPASVYSFVKKLKIAETDFYDFYPSFDSIEKNLWVELTLETIHAIEAQEVWSQYSSREKILSFFYSYVEVLKKHRSFIIYSLKKHQHKFGTPEVLSGVRSIFENFAEGVINEGLESGELANRKFLSKRYKDAVWVQFGFIVNFWTTDDSAGFEKTDEVIEKGVNVTFDLFERSPLDNLLEYGKFLSRNGNFKEKMGL